MDKIERPLSCDNWSLAIAYPDTPVDKLISKDTGLPVTIVDDPLSCGAVGTGKALENEELFSTMLSEY